MECRRCNVVSERIRKAGFFKNRNGVVQRYFCPNCRRYFSISNNNGMRIKKDKIHMVINLLCESNGIRAISRLTKLHQETVLKILRLSGKISAKLAQDKIKYLKCEVVQVDEIHSIVYAKDWGLKEKHDGRGSQYTFLAIDAKSRMIINNLTGLRTVENAVSFFTDLRRRVSGRFQLNTDAWQAYAGRTGAQNSIKTVFGGEIDHATEEKEFYKLNQFVTRTLARTKRKARVGNPDLDKASTSYVERTNLNLRLFNRRFTRSTLGFSKKLINLRHSIALFSWHQNFVKKHATLKTSPAILLGISTVLMTVEELWDYTS